MRSRVVVSSGLLGAILGAAVAYIGATRIFTCSDSTFEAVCAGGYPIIAIAWGVAIGSTIGLAAAFLLLKHLSAR
jgi:hypothetical protein